MKLFDAHLHFFCRDFLLGLARAAAASRSGEDAEEILERAAGRAGFELPPRDPIAHLERWIKDLDHHGVDRAVLFASSPEEADAVRAACLDADDRFIPFTVVNPAAQEGAAFARKALREMGFRGVLLFPSLHHYKPASPACLAVLEEVEAVRGVVVVQCGMLEIKVRDLLGLPRAYDMSFANPLDVIPAANRFPRTQFVIPHFGAGLFREALIAGAQCSNVILDSSGSNGWMRTDPANLNLEGVFRRALEVVGPGRILFGTDSTTFPRGWRADVFKAQAAALERLEVSLDDRHRIFGENLARVLDLRP